MRARIMRRWYNGCTTYVKDAAHSFGPRGDDLGGLLGRPCDTARDTSALSRGEPLRLLRRDAPSRGLALDSDPHGQALDREHADHVG